MHDFMYLFMTSEAPRSPEHSGPARKRAHVERPVRVDGVGELVGAGAGEVSRGVDPLGHPVGVRPRAPVAVIARRAQADGRGRFERRVGLGNLVGADTRRELGAVKGTRRRPQRQLHRRPRLPRSVQRLWQEARESDVAGLARRLKRRAASRVQVRAHARGLLPGPTRRIGEHGRSVVVARASARRRVRGRARRARRHYREVLFLIHRRRRRRGWPRFFPASARRRGPRFEHGRALRRDVRRGFQPTSFQSTIMTIGCRLRRNASTRVERALPSFFQICQHWNLVTSRHKLFMPTILDCAEPPDVPKVWGGSLPPLSATLGSFGVTWGSFFLRTGR